MPYKRGRLQFSKGTGWEHVKRIVVAQGCRGPKHFTSISTRASPALTNGRGKDKSLCVKLQISWRGLPRKGWEKAGEKVQFGRASWSGKRNQRKGGNPGTHQTHRRLGGGRSTFFFFFLFYAVQVLTLISAFVTPLAIQVKKNVFSGSSEPECLLGISPRPTNKSEDQECGEDLNQPYCRLL